MNRTKLLVAFIIVGLCLLAIPVARSIADAAKDAKPAASAQPPAMKLPPGWTEADVQACMLAGTPGKMHEYLAKSVGTWRGKTTMWMAPGAEPMTGECTYTITPMMEGRYFKCEITGEMPPMGSYNGLGITGFDNVSQKFVSNWIDNHNTGILQGAGELSADSKTLTWAFVFNCPITQKPTTIRQIETITGADTKTLDMHGVEPKSGKEFHQMHIEFTRK